MPKQPWSRVVCAAKLPLPGRLVWAHPRGWFVLAIPRADRPPAGKEKSLQNLTADYCRGLVYLLEETLATSTRLPSGGKASNIYAVQQLGGLFFRAPARVILAT